MIHCFAITLFAVIVSAADRSISSYTFHTPTSKIINYDVNVHQSNNKKEEVYPLSKLLDITSSLGPKVSKYNIKHPLTPIKLYAKAEFGNPASKSHKDRIARAIINEAMSRGELTRSNGGKKTSEYY